jgi:hypothetical protein
MRVAARERFAISMHRRVRLLGILKWRKPMYQWLHGGYIAPKKKARYVLNSRLLVVFGGTCGGRTHDKRIKSPLLYQLS